MSFGAFGLIFDGTLESGNIRGIEIPINLLSIIVQVSSYLVAFMGIIEFVQPKNYVQTPCEDSTLLNDKPGFPLLIEHLPSL